MNTPIAPTEDAGAAMPLYLITHQQLSAGYQIAQVAHAVADFSIRLPQTFQKWHGESQYIVSLATPCSTTLSNLFQQLIAEGHVAIPFHEPDLDHELTAFAVAPHPALKKRLSNLPLAGPRKEKKK